MINTQLNVDVIPESGIPADKLSQNVYETIQKKIEDGDIDISGGDLALQLTTLRNDFDNLVKGDTTVAIKTFNEVIAFLNGIEDTQDLQSIIGSIQQEIGKKINESDLHKIATSGDYNDLDNKPTIPSAVTESTVSGWGFTKNTGTYNKPSGGIPKTDLASAVQTSLGKADTALQSYTEQYKGTVTGVKINGTTKTPSNGTVDLGTVITSHQDISGKQDTLISGSTIKTINGESILGNGDITIEIPNEVTENTVSGWGFTKNTGTYSKPSGGIPKTDLASAVQTSLSKADTALQSYTEQYKGTITGVSANGTSVSTSGVANIPAASTSAYGVTKLTSAVNSTSTTLAATASAVKTAYDLANNYKGTVTGVKINGTTYQPSSGIVDLGTIESGGSSDANVQAVDTGDVLDDVTVDYATTAYVDGLVGDINSVLESIINGGVSLITFTIDGTVCQAEEGMTFYDWAISDYYNTNAEICGTNGQPLNEFCAGYNKGEIEGQVAYNTGFIAYTPSIVITSIIQDGAIYNLNNGISGGSDY